MFTSNDEMKPSIPFTVLLFIYTPGSIVMLVLAFVYDWSSTVVHLSYWSFLFDALFFLLLCRTNWKRLFAPPKQQQQQQHVPYSRLETTLWMFDTHLSIFIVIVAVMIALVSHPTQPIVDESDSNPPSTWGYQVFLHGANLLALLLVKLFEPTATRSPLRPLQSSLLVLLVLFFYALVLYLAGSNILLIYNIDDSANSAMALSMTGIGAFFGSSVIVETQWSNNDD